MESGAEASDGWVTSLVGPRPRDVWESGEDKFGSLRVFTADPTTLPTTLRRFFGMWLGISHQAGVVDIAGARATTQIVVGEDLFPRLYRANCLTKGLEFVAGVLEVVEQIAGSREGVVGIGSSGRHTERQLSIRPDKKIANRDLRMSMVARLIKRRPETYPSAFLTILRLFGRSPSDLGSLNERSSVLCARAGSKRSGWPFTVIIELQSFFASSWDCV